jgi:FKBP-type peptidyl-prolyl cis-trans isomerase
MSFKPISTLVLLGALAAPHLSAQAPEPQVDPPAQAEAPASSQPAEATTTVPVAAQLELATDDQKTLYALGMALSQSLSRLDLEASELAFVVEGLEDGVLGETPRVPMAEYSAKVQLLAQERFAAVAEREAASTQQFLTRMAGEQGATKTESGIVWFQLEEGTGPMPVATDVVRVHYRGTLADGTVFDSSIDRGEPASFGLDQVIPCWTEALQKVKVGGKIRIVCPPDLAYGAQGRPGIPPNAALVFEVELLAIGEEPPANSPSGSTGREEILQQLAARY